MIKRNTEKISWQHEGTRKHDWERINATKEEIEDEDYYGDIEDIEEFEDDWQAAFPAGSQGFDPELEDENAF